MSKSITITVKDPKAQNVTPNESITWTVNDTWEDEVTKTAISGTVDRLRKWEKTKQHLMPTSRKLVCRGINHREDKSE